MAEFGVAEYTGNPNNMNPRANVLLGVQAAAEYLKAQGIKPRRRDRREPGRREKEQMEARISGVMRRIFRKQLASIRARLEIMYPDRKALVNVPVLGFIDDWEAEDEAELIRLLTQAVRGGAILFAGGAVPGMSMEQIHANVLAFIRSYFYDTFKDGLNKTTINVLSKALTSFVSSPGYTIGQLIRDIEPIFGAGRAERIAVTEVTRAYARGQRIAGEQVRQEYPSIQIVKQWFTNNDELVCDLCRPLNGLIVEFDEPYDEANQIYEPPCHVGDRCWQVVNTNVGGGMNPTVG